MIEDGNQDYLKIISLHLVVHWLTYQTNSWGISTQQNWERKKNMLQGFHLFFSEPFSKSYFLLSTL